MELVESPPVSALEILLLGSFTVRVEGHPLPRLRTRKGQSLLALLALRPGRAVEREWLAGTLWPESAERQAYANLRLCLVDLRHALGAQAYRLQAPSTRTLRLDTTDITVDVLDFDDAVKCGDTASLERATALYRGPLLEDCLEEWILPEREARAVSYLQALESLAAGAMERGESATAAHYLRLILARDPLRETAQRSLMQALVQQGSYAAAVLSYRGFRIRLRQEMGAEPDAETRTLFEQLRIQARSRARSTARREVMPEKSAVIRTPEPLNQQPVSLPSNRRNNLPHQRTSFIGRVRELEDISRLLLSEVIGEESSFSHPNPRLITLTGAGGNGKTRLALRIGEAQSESYSDGVWLIELAPLSDGALLPQAVASALGVSEQAGLPLLDTLETYLRTRSLLLILDNCEHLLDSCARLADRLLRNCPYLRILATSRELLRVAGEFAFRVPALELPDSRETLSADRALQYEAIRLFMERALFNQPTFKLTNANLLAVVQICRRLDGNPLAIELAAARMSALTVEQLSKRLDDRFNLLTNGSRAALPRQQTLRAAIDWSYDLLDEPERRLLRHLSVFAGGCTLESAEAICAGAENAYAVLDQLSSLVNKSLVVAEDTGDGTGMRYYLLESVRQYAQERLVENGEAKSTRERHVQWFLQLSEQAEAGMWTGRSWMGQLEAEHDNLRAALEYCRDLGDDCESGMRLAGTLAQFWYMRGFWSEGRDWVEGMLQQGHGQISKGHAKALFGAGILAWIQDDYRKARPLLEKSIVFWQELGDEEFYFVTLLVLGSVLGTMGEYESGKTILEECLEYFLRAGPLDSAVFCMAYLSRNAFEQEDYAAARTLSERCLALARDLDHHWGSAFALTQLSLVAEKEGDYYRALTVGNESLTVSYQISNPRGVARSQLVLALIACRQSQFVEAATYLKESGRLFQELGDKEGICQTLEGMALLSALSDQSENAIRFLTTAQNLRDAVGIPLPPSSCTLKESWWNRVRDQLGDETISRLGTETLRLPPAQVLVIAIDEALFPSP